MQLIAVATYPNFDFPMVDLVYQVAPGRYRLHEGVCSERPADEGEEIDELELIEWAALFGENVIMVEGHAGAWGPRRSRRRAEGRLDSHLSFLS